MLPSLYVSDGLVICRSTLQEEVIVVDLDGGTLTVPKSVTLYSFPPDILYPLKGALKRVCSVGVLSSSDSTSDGALMTL